MQYFSVTPVLPREIECNTGTVEGTELTNEALTILEEEKIKRENAQLTFLDGYKPIGVDQSRLAPTQQHHGDRHDSVDHPGEGIEPDDSFDSVLPTESLDDSMNMTGGHSD